MGLEVGQQRKEDGERELKDFRDGRDAVLGQRHTQVLLDGVNEHLIGLEDGACILQDGQEQLKGQDLRAELVRPGGEEDAEGVAIIRKEKPPATQTIKTSDTVRWRK